MLLALASAVFLRSESLGLETIFYCLRFETFFSSPPTTRRVTVEVFDPASTLGTPLGTDHTEIAAPLLLWESVFRDVA
jgi:hypothetical protein